MEKEKSIEYVQKELKEYGSQIYEYGGQSFIAIKNPYGKSHMAITFGEENMTMEFASQSARFAYGNEEDLVKHAAGYLNGELCAVEFYLGDQPLFGGSRTSDGMNFLNTEELSDWYAGGNKEIAANINEFLKKYQITVVCSRWTDLPDRAVITDNGGGVSELK